MKFDDTKKIFENWKSGINNRLDEMFVPEISEEKKEEDDVKDKKDKKVLFGEEETEELKEISPIPTPIPGDEENSDEVSEEYDPEKADLDNDGKVDDWEEAKGKAAFGESKENLEEKVRAKIREAILGVVLKEQVPGADDAFSELGGAMDDYDTPDKVGDATKKDTSLKLASEKPVSVAPAKAEPVPGAGAALGAAAKAGSTTTLRTGTGDAGKKISGGHARMGGNAPQQGESKEDYVGRMNKKGKDTGMSVNRWKRSQNESVEKPSNGEVLNELNESVEYQELKARFKKLLD